MFAHVSVPDMPWENILDMLFKLSSLPCDKYLHLFPSMYYRQSNFPIPPLQHNLQDTILMFQRQPTKITFNP
jgi:hypothetical protein